MKGITTLITMIAVITIAIIFIVTPTVLATAIVMIVVAVIFIIRQHLMLFRVFVC